MLRQLIGQVKQLLQQQNTHSPSSSSSSSSSSNFSFPLQSPPLLHLPRCYVLNLDDSSAEDSCYNIIMTAGKSENLKMLEPGKPPPKKKARKERNRGKVTGTSCSIENLDPQIWKEFPEDLFEAVVARLPIATFFHLQICLPQMELNADVPKFF